MPTCQADVSQHKLSTRLQNQKLVNARQVQGCTRFAACGSNRHIHALVEARSGAGCVLHTVRLPATLVKPQAWEPNHSPPTNASVWPPDTLKGSGAPWMLDASRAKSECISSTATPEDFTAASAASRAANSWETLPIVWRVAVCQSASADGNVHIMLTSFISTWPMPTAVYMRASRVVVGRCGSWHAHLKLARGWSTRTFNVLRGSQGNGNLAGTQSVRCCRWPLMHVSFQLSSTTHSLGVPVVD